MHMWGNSSSSMQTKKDALKKKKKLSKEWAHGVGKKHLPTSHS